MASITLNFSNTINEAAAVGDTVFYVDNTASLGGFNNNSSLDDVIKLGTITALTSTSITATTPDNVSPPANNDFIFISKDNTANLSSIIGYYAEVKLVNNSTVKSEVFTVGLGVSESSK
jgi:hypothetical protein